MCTRPVGPPPLPCDAEREDHGELVAFEEVVAGDGEDEMSDKGEESGDDADGDLVSGGSPDMDREV